MPTITLDRKEFERLVGKKLPDDTLKNRISMLGTDLEEVNGKEIIVEVFPNRPDMLSEQGFARAFSSFIGNKTGLKNYKVKKSNDKVIVDKSVKDVRPFTACAIVKNLKLDDKRIEQIMQLQEKLHVTFGRNRKKAAIGVYPLERIKMPITFLGMKPEEIKFKPLEYHKELNGYDILKLHPKGKEYAGLLNGRKVFPVFIDAAGKILSMPPIINSDDVGKVVVGTKDVFVECSGFDFNTLKQCLNIVVTALADMNGEVYSIDVVDGRAKEITPSLEPWKINLDAAYVNKILGLNLNEKQIKNYLERMGFGYQSKKVLVPAYRADILHQIDIVEDIAIAYGYENFKEELPNVSTIASEDKERVLKEKIIEILTGLGLLEVSSYTLMHRDDCKKCLMSKEVVELGNALDQDYNALKASLIPSLLKIISENKHNEYPQNIFELNTVFSKGTGETGVVERDNLCIALTSSNAGFTDIKQIMDCLFKLLNVSYKLEEKDIGMCISGRAGEIAVNGKKIGVIGELHPQVLLNFNLDYPAALLDLNVDLLIGCLESK
ncbi:MAG TPA: phenylalanine--tRNA ligase subunit beta [Candidatus Nanoarchaeia archaeon]|nr:phenylalanine--tRNA ligase subunit beta [Candidatus Nanoarchaeia archaeon]